MKQEKNGKTGGMNGPKSVCPPQRLAKTKKDTKRKGGSALEEKESLEIEDGVEKNLGTAIKKGMKTPHIKVIGRLLLATLIIASIATFVTGLMKYSELQREKEALEKQVEEKEAEKEKLEYLIDCPVDYDYIVRIAREKLNLYLPDEIVYHNDTNK